MNINIIYNHVRCSLKMKFMQIQDLLRDEYECITNYNLLIGLVFDISLLTTFSPEEEVMLKKC